MASDFQTGHSNPRNHGRFRPASKPKPRHKPRTLPMPEMSAWAIGQLWRRVQKGGPDDCWLWSGARTRFGHGRIKLGGKLYLPHRLIYALHVGALENARQYHGTVIRHRCDNPACCNPRHLQPGTQAVNVADMFARGREPGQCKRNQEDE